MNFRQGRLLAMIFSRRSCVVVLTSLLGCGSSAPKEASHPVAEEPLVLGPDTSKAAPTSGPMPTLAGATLGSPMNGFHLHPDPHPPDEFIHLQAITWFVPQAQQKVGDVMPAQTHYAFQSEKLVTIRLEIKGIARCKAVRANFESTYGTPTTKDDREHVSMLDWKQGTTSAAYRSVFWKNAPQDDACSVWVANDQAESDAFASEPTPSLGHGIDHFGRAKIGASKASFSGLTSKQKDGNSEWMIPPDLTYRGIALSPTRTTYKFVDDTLVNIGFEAKSWDDCPKLLSLLKSEYGAFEQHSNFGGGASYDWVDAHGKLTFNMFDSTKSCGGILFQQ